MGDVNTFVSELDQAELSRDGVDLEHIESQEKEMGTNAFAVLALIIIKERNVILLSLAWFDRINMEE